MTTRKNLSFLRFWAAAPLVTQKPDITLALVKAIAKLPRPQAMDMARLVLLAQQYLEEGTEPPIGLVEPEGDKA